MARRRFLEVFALGSVSLRLAPARGRAITGLGPAVVVGQNPLNRNPNSTLATASGLHPFLRLLYARFGTRHCAGCGAPLAARSAGGWRRWTRYPWATSPWTGGADAVAGRGAAGPPGGRAHQLAGRHAGYLSRRRLDFGYFGENGPIYAETVHIQGYDQRPPARNPAPGRLQYKFDIQGQESGRLDVGYSHFVGTHVALLHEVPCPQRESVGRGSPAVNWLGAVAAVTDPGIRLPDAVVAQPGRSGCHPLVRQLTRPSA